MQHIDPEDLALLALRERIPTREEAAHLAACGACADELKQFDQVVSTARQAGAETLQLPPPRVWAAIAAGTIGTDSRIVHGTPDASARPLRSRRTRAGILGLVAGLVLGSAITAGLWHRAERDAPPTTSATITLQTLPQFPQWNAASGTADLRSGQGTESVDVTVRGVSGSGFLEVWLLGRDGVSMISLGDLGSAQTGTFTIPPGTDMRFYTRIDISLQPFDGSTQHTASSVLRGTIPPLATR